MTEQDPADTDISRLLRLAGRRPAPPPDAAARVHDALRAQWQATVSARRWRRRATAAALVAAAVAGVMLAGRLSPPDLPETAATIVRVTGGGLRMEGPRGGPLGSGAEVPVGAWLETAADGRAALGMAPAVSLRLDRGTRVHFRERSSLWLDRGAVYIASDEAADSAPLRIDTREGQVTDVGTQFQVRVAPGGVQVHVREGRVFVLGASGRHDASAGTRLDMASGGVRRKESPGHGAEWAWVEQAGPGFDIEGATLQAFLDWASHETGLRIRFESEGVQRVAEGTTLHGSSAGLTASEAIEAVLPASGFAGRRRDGTLWIRRTGEAP